MNIVMFSAEFFPPKKMNANHNRLLHLAQGISKWHNVIITCPNNKNKYEKTYYDGVKIMRFPIIPMPFIRKIFMVLFAHRYIKKILKKENIAIDMLWYNSNLSFMLSKKFDCIKIYDVMGIQSNELLTKNTIYSKAKSLFHKKTEKILYNNSSIVTTINNAHKKIISRQFDKKVYILRDAVEYNKGINAGLYLHLKNQYKHNFILFFVGSFGRKRFEKNIDAFEPLIKSVPDIKIILAGDGEYKKQYKKIFKERKIDKYFEWAGFVSGKELNSYIKLSDICFADVYLDGFPFKIFEYMAMGKVALVEETLGVKEILIDKENSLLYKNSKEFVEKVLLIINNPALRKKIEKNAKIESKNHTWMERAKQFNAIIDEVFNDKKTD